MVWSDCGIYVIRNSVDGKVYVGSAQSIKNRWARHLKMLRQGTHDNPKLQRAWNKYGKDCFEFEAVLFCPDTDLFWYEQLAINAFDAVALGYNIARVAGSSMAGRKHSQATKNLMSATRKGRKQSPEWVSKRTSGFKGRPISAKQKRQISKTLTGKQTPEFSAWLSRKGAATRWGKEFNEPKPDKCFHEYALPDSSMRVPPIDSAVTGGIN